MNAPWSLATLTAIGLTAAGLFALNGEPAAPAVPVGNEVASEATSSMIVAASTTTTQPETKRAVDNAKPQLATLKRGDKSASTTTTIPAEMPAELVELQKRIPDETTTTTEPEQSTTDCEWMTGECDQDRDYVDVQSVGSTGPGSSASR